MRLGLDSIGFSRAVAKEPPVECACSSYLAESRRLLLLESSRPLQADLRWLSFRFCFELVAVVFATDIIQSAIRSSLSIN